MLNQKDEEALLVYFNLQRTRAMFGFEGELKELLHTLLAEEQKDAQHEHYTIVKKMDSATSIATPFEIVEGSIKQLRTGLTPLEQFSYTTLLGEQVDFVPHQDKESTFYLPVIGSDKTLVITQETDQSLPRQHDSAVLLTPSVHFETTLLLISYILQSKLLDAYKGESIDLFFKSSGAIDFNSAVKDWLQQAGRYLFERYPLLPSFPIGIVAWLQNSWRSHEMQLINPALDPVQAEKIRKARTPFPTRPASPV